MNTKKIIWVLGILLIIILGIILFKSERGKKDEIFETKPTPVVDEKTILNSLSAPTTTKPLNNKEQNKTLESLSVPTTKKPVAEADDAQRKILESLQAK